MKKQFLMVALTLFIGIFTQPQSLFAAYPCDFSYPGETGNCEGCGDLSPADCHRDCIPTWSGYNCSQVKKVTPICAINVTYYNNASCSCPINTIKDFIYGGFGGFSCALVCQMNVIYSYNRNYSDTCRCPLNTTKLVVSTTNSSQLDSFKCVSYNPHPLPNPTPQPEPITYCELNKPYSFLIFPKETACTCPADSNLVIPNWPTGTYSFTCVATNVPSPVQYCEMNKSYFYNFSQTPCTCPTDSYKIVLASYGYTGGQSFKCVSNYQPHPSPAVCSYNQYWSGSSCVDYYQPYIPFIQPVIQYPSVYDWQYYGQHDYNYNWPNMNKWGNVDWEYSS